MKLARYKKNKYCIVPPTCGIYNRQIHRNRKLNCDFQGLEEGKNELFKEHRVSVLPDEKLHCITVGIWLILLNCALKNGYDGKFYVMFLPQFKKINNRFSEYDKVLVIVL